MSRGYDRETRGSRDNTSRGLGTGPKTVPIRGGKSASFGHSQASRKAFAGMTPFEQRTGKSQEAFEADQAAQRARCLARAGITPAAATKDKH